MLESIAGVGMFFLYTAGPGAAVGALIGGLVGALAPDPRTRTARDRVLVRCVVVGTIAGLLALPGMLFLLAVLFLSPNDIPPPS